ncbi:MAG: alpha/beta hydrolase family protein [Steroidobacteraceae bacterium]
MLGAFRATPWFACFVLAACGAGGPSPSPSSSSMPPASAGPPRGQLLSTPPAQIGSYAPSDLLGFLGVGTLGQELLTLAYSPACTVNVYHIEYETVGGQGEPATATGALMVPSGSASACRGPRPIVLYAHGTTTDRNYDIANISASGNEEGLILAAVFAAQGYIVVAPNYAGYDISSLDYHPYLEADQQSKDMIDALTAARAALPVSLSPLVSDDHKLFITGYSQGGFVAMATHRAMQAAGMTVTASGPMSGPYALAAFGDAVFMGDVNGGAIINFVLIAESYQRAYGNLYSAPTDIFAPQYASGIDSLLPSTALRSTLYAEGKLPENALFSSTAPAPQYASLTPSTMPGNLAPAFALGFGPNYLVINAYRLAYLQDAAANPDGGFPDTTTGVPAPSPANALRQDLKTNDLRNWSPSAPVLLCAGNGDPTVFYLNTQLMEGYWAAHPPPAPVTVLDVDSPVGPGDPYATIKQGFAAAKAAVALTQGETGVLEAYHTDLIPPFCLSAVKTFFDSH